MNRAIKLRTFQLLHDSKWPTLVALFGIAVTIVDQIFFKSITSNTFHNYPLLINILDGILGIVSFNIFMWPIFDGASHFDSALRFGISRKHYFIINIILYFLSTVVNIMIKSLNGIPWQGSYAKYFEPIWQQMNIDNILGNFIIILMIAIFIYGYYKFGWKIFLTLLIIPILAMLTSGLSSIESLMFIYQKLVEIGKFIEQYALYLQIITTIILLAIYYLCITKFEIRD